MDTSIRPCSIPMEYYAREKNGLSPEELFSGVKFPEYHQLQHLNVWGFPTFVLDPKLQDGKKLPKWSPRARQGQYLGRSKKHSSTVGPILNISTGHTSPKYHCVYDDHFSTVLNAEANSVIDHENFTPESWQKLCEAGLEKVIEPDQDKYGNPIPFPELHDSWLTPGEITGRENHRKRRHQRALNRRVEPSEVSGGEDSDDDSESSSHSTQPFSAPEGETIESLVDQSTQPLSAPEGVTIESLVDHLESELDNVVNYIDDILLNDESEPP